MNKNMLSKGFLSGAMGSIFATILIYLRDANEADFEWWIYIFMGSSLILLFLHLLLRERGSYELETMKMMVQFLFLYLPIIFVFALMHASYIIMFISIGLLAITYLIYLLIGVLKLKGEEK